MSLPFIHSEGVFIEIGQNSLKVLDGDAGLELALERREGGRLTDVCKARLAADLRGFLSKASWRGRRRAYCAIGARGVSLRRLTLPSASEDELHRLLLLQIESQFPLPPEELAWGYRQLQGNGAPRNGPATSQELIVAAVKRELVEEYSTLLVGCGLNPVFTLGVLARSFICPQPSGSYAVLDIGRTHSELVSVENGVPSAIRVLPWGGENITRAIDVKLKVGHAEAEKLKLRLEQQSAPQTDLDRGIQDAVRVELESLAHSVKNVWSGRDLYVSGRTALLKEIIPSLTKVLDGGGECKRMGIMPGEGRSAAILGLRKWSQNDQDGRLLVLQTAKARDGESRTRPSKTNWAAVGVGLALAWLFLRYAEALFQTPRLSKRLAEIKAHQGKLPNIDRELTFLQYLKTNQPPYLDALMMLANAAPGGTRFDSVSMNRGGDLTLRGTMQNAQQATDFRSKLIESGFFATVTPEELTPSPDRQKLTVRIVAQWKSSSARESLSIPVPSQPAEKAKPGGSEVKPDAARNAGMSLPESSNQPAQKPGIKP